jgi:hypothetical protein
MAVVQTVALDCVVELMEAFSSFICFQSIWEFF